jgi:hypothetical protein
VCSVLGHDHVDVWGQRGVCSCLCAGSSWAHQPGVRVCRVCHGSVPVKRWPGGVAGWAVGSDTVGTGGVAQEGHGLASCIRRAVCAVRGAHVRFYGCICPDGPKGGASSPDGSLARPRVSGACAPPWAARTDVLVIFARSAGPRDRARFSRGLSAMHACLGPILFGAAGAGRGPSSSAHGYFIPAEDVDAKQRVTAQRMARLGVDLVWGGRRPRWA